MKLRMALATSALVVGTFALSACSLPGSGNTDPQSTTATDATMSPTDTPTTPSAPATISAAADLVGDWQDSSVPWVVHFKADGTYSEDYKDLKDFRVGTYEVSGTEVSLIGGDGETDKGSIDGDKVSFRLGTLTRK